MVHEREKSSERDSILIQTWHVMWLSLKKAVALKSEDNRRMVASVVSVLTCNIKTGFLLSSSPSF